jgi:photosystem II stability/assembly factor-like uncharacterized protein
MSKTSPQLRGENQRQTPRQSFYQRKRRIIWWGAAVALAVAISVLAGRGGGDQITSGAFTGGDFHSLVVDPQNPRRIFAGGHEAVSVSTDGGMTWRQISSLEDRDAMGWGFDREFIYVGGHPGLSVSSDDGKVFRVRDDGLPATDIHALGSGGGVLYAASPAVGLFASADGGNSWDVINTDKGRAFFGRILVDPADPEHVIAADTLSGVSESYDGGRSFNEIGGLEWASWVSWDPENRKRIVASSPGGAALSDDGGNTWRPLSPPAAGSILELDPTAPQMIYAGVHEGSTVDLFVSNDGGQTWEER